MQYTNTQSTELNKIKEPVFRCLKDVKSKNINWLWNGRIAKGKITMISGDPGLGKSQLSLSIAAIVSTGGRWPLEEGRASQGKVIIISCEDDAEDSIKPRLVTISAEMDNIFILDGFTKKHKPTKEFAFGLSQDLDVLETMIRKIGNVDLVILDPISAFLDSVDSHKNSEVRGILAPVSKLAAKHETAVLCISHPPKSQSGDPIHKVSGSLAFMAAPRAAYLVLADPEDYDKRLFLPTKNNLSEDHKGLAFRIEKAETEEGVQTSKVVWDPNPVNETAEHYLNFPRSYKKPSGTDASEDWLKERLTNSKVSANQIFKDGEKKGFTPKMLRDAKERLGVRSKKQDFGKGWTWELPETELARD